MPGKIIKKTQVKKPIKKPVKKQAKAKRITESFKQSLKPVIKRKNVDVSKLISSGCTTFNLECSGRVEGAFLLGKMANLIGDSHAGKTLALLTIFAECANDPRFDDYELIYDDVEAACEFDIEYLFGSVVSKRIDTSYRSRTIEQFNDHLAELNENGTKYIYGLDSFDALTTETALKKDKENRKKRGDGKDTSGSYGDGKAKLASEMFSKRTQEMDDIDSALFIISQTRDNIGFGAMFTPKTRSGGRALKFYAFHEIWYACQKKVKRGKRTLLTNVQAKITKNKLIGRHGEAYFPILFDYGIDDITSSVNFLMDEKYWRGTKKSVDTKGFVDEKMSFAKLIEFIEENELEDELKQCCQKCYDNIIEAMRPKRKRKYN
jgi:RecA/RadA recombinase